MPSDSRWYLVCYDVRDDKRLRKVAKHLEGYGSRLQYSVFRCWLSPRQMERLRFELTQDFVTTDDDVMFIPICARCVEGLAVTHTSTKKPDWPDTPKSHNIV
jgi:CRISPR-associated protein Cas2